MSYCLLHGPSSSTNYSTANYSVLPYYANYLLFSITTTITITTVTAIATATTITAAVIISSLLLF